MLRRGQSYLLAALVVLLLRDFLNGLSQLRVVYVPDCTMLLKSWKLLKLSLLLAFADDTQVCQSIINATQMKQLVTLSSNQKRGTLLFVVDQYNALSDQDEKDDRQSVLKNEIDTFLNECSIDHFIIRAVSINDQNRAKVDRKQTNEMPLSLFGELSPVSSGHSFSVSSQFSC